MPSTSAVPFPPAGELAALVAAGGTLVLDGGLSNQLADQGCDLRDPLWTARLLADEPGQIEAAHRAYVRAGADVLITSAYQASYEGFARRGIGRAEAAGLLRRSVDLARRAAAERPGVRVAASVGPYGAVLADGSEYRGRYGLTVRELERFHRPRIDAVAAASPDVLALETVPDVDEAEAMLRAAAPTGLPVWLSYTVDGERTRAGQPLAEAFALAAGRDEVVAVGVNCCAPQDVQAAVELAVAVCGKPAVAYPNSGERWNAAAHRWEGGGVRSPSLASLATAWHASGARLIGGCCRVGPPTVTAIRAALPGVR
ncbi:homocysteine S-methyltransferase [Actinacidiphila bryophytorum]|uniref:Homocysteine S-methyltransferase n=1 Tax=Actinacidiphila bryophytorum TaxID=1436133 RepID=A0A9W4H6G7_9ACTN|nr:homocysteine S-methyltransferase [Actinacidiphila bryophytorum]MBM9436741.1 homocysteine S-methyltransferase [Actinacidiphila bryophytorum]MBN6548000.1 homocysteine S-methyltransferase [Actinacidiphila bryophytorum]CAG7654188.1 Homocysteine S-methyltransferase [Actinacidiphila bryophytorum]